MSAASSAALAIATAAELATGLAVSSAALAIATAAELEATGLAASGAAQGDRGGDQVGSEPRGFRNRLTNPGSARADLA